MTAHLLTLLALAADPYAVVLGVAQDAGHPQAGCDKTCCQKAWADASARHMVASLAIVDPDSGQRWLIDATPDLPDQLRMLDALQPVQATPGLDGILLTHAHIGHYTGLMHLGREVMGADAVPVMAMPRMATFLATNGPWSQLVSLHNIEILPLTAGTPVPLNARITVTAIEVPHRDEYSETVAYRVEGPDHAILYLPDIDKWDRWDTPIEEVLATVDRAWLDATFFEDAEIPGRDMSQIPHPFVRESIDRFTALKKRERRKVVFLHFNHTNPLLDAEGDAADEVRAAGMGVAKQGDRFDL